MDHISWNTDRETLPDGKLRHEISCRRWKNFRKPGGKWEKIYATIPENRSVSKFPVSVQFPKTAQGWANFVFDSDYSVQRKIEEGNDSNSEPEFIMDVQVESQHNVAGIVGLEGNPDQIIYPDAWNGSDLIYEVNRNSSASVKKLVRINSEPPGDSEFIEYSFLMSSPHARVMVGRNRSTRPWAGIPGDSSRLKGGRAFIARNDSEIRGASLQEPRCWYTRPDGTVVHQDVEVSFRILSNGETVRATKRIPRSMVKAAMSEGVPLWTDAVYRTDDSGATGSDHASYWTGNDTWANARGANGTAWSDHYFGWFNYLISMSTTENQYDDIRRMFFFWDTSAASGTVTSADIQVYGHGAADAIFMLSGSNFYGTTSTGTTSGANSDYQTVQTTPLATEVMWVPTTSGFETYTLNASGEAEIDVDGFSRFCLAFSHDIENFEPAMWTSGATTNFDVRLSEYAGDFGPRLTVTTEGAAGLSVPIAHSYYGNLRSR